MFLGRGMHGTTASECGSTPSRLCKTRYNTTAPMYGVSLTSGQPVTIVQKFPDLLQQVVFEVSVGRCKNYVISSSLLETLERTRGVTKVPAMSTQP